MVMDRLGDAEDGRFVTAARVSACKSFVALPVSECTLYVTCVCM